MIPASSRSYFEVEFTLSEAAPFRLNGGMAGSTSVNSGAEAQVLVRAQDGALVFLEEGPSCLVTQCEEPFDRRLRLQPGIYRLVAEATASARSGSVGSSFSIHFADVPEPGLLAPLGLGLGAFSCMRRTLRPRG